MADELDPVEQQFIADMLPYIEAVQNAVKDAHDFAEANLEASAAVDDMRDHSAEASVALDELFRHSDEVVAAQHELRDASVEAGEAMGHVRDEAAEASVSVRELGDSADETAAKLDLMGLSGASTFTSLGPLLGLIGGLVIAAAAVAPAVSAMGLGFGAFGALAIPAIHGVMSGLQQVTAAQQAVQNATTATARATAQAHLAQDWANMSPPIRDAVKQLLAFKNEFVTLGKTSGIQGAVLGDITKVLQIARELLPQIVPLAQAGAKAFGGLLNSISAGVKSQGFVTFLHTMTALVGPATAAISHLSGALLGVLGHALEALAPMSVPFINFITVLVKALGGPLTAGLHVIIALFLGLAHAIEPLLPGLSKIATILINDIGSSFQALVPIIGQVVSILGGALLKILRDLLPVIANALTPNSPFLLALRLLPGLLRLILPAFTALAAVFADPHIAQLAVAVISLIVAFKGLMGALALARAGFALLTAVMDVNPIFLIITAIGLLVVAFIYLWDHFKGFRDFWKDAWHDIQAVFSVVVDWIKSHWLLLLAVLTGPIGAAVIFVITHFQMLKNGAVRLLGDVISFVRSIPGRILSALGNLGSLLWNAGKAVIQGLINGIKSMFGSLGSVASSIGGFIAGLKGPLPKDLTLLVPHGQAIMQGLMNGITSKKGELAALLGSVTGAIPGAVAGAGAGGAAPSVHVTVPVTLGAGAGGYNSPQFLHYLQGAVQEAVLRYTQVNPSNGLGLAGKLS